jgi:hypothetical protein
MLLPNDAEWEDAFIYLNFHEALEGLQRASSDYRLERFVLANHRYKPDYICYYFENGQLISKQC